MMWWFSFFQITGFSSAEKLDFKGKESFMFVFFLIAFGPFDHTAKTERKENKKE